MAVTLLLCLLEATIILFGQSQASLLEVVTAQAHQLIRLTTQIHTRVTGSTTKLLEVLVTLRSLL